MGKDQTISQKVSDMMTSDIIGLSIDHEKTYYHVKKDYNKIFHKLRDDYHNRRSYWHLHILDILRKKYEGEKS